MRRLVLAAILALVPGVADAQKVEVGATIAAGCLGSDGSACGTGTHAMLGAHASWWIDDRVELSARVARVALPSRRSETVFPTAVTIEVDDRSREFVSALLVYHFRRGKAIRPALGMGSGVYAHSQRVSCEPAVCNGIPGLPPQGRRRTSMRDVILFAGVAGAIGDRWMLRGGCLSHRLFNDENSTMELLVGVGYRFGSN